MSDENVGGLVELLPCPFCGGTDIGDEHVVTYSVDSSYDTFGCRTCGARFENGNASQWNTRVSAHGENASVQTPVVDEAMVERFARGYFGDRYTSEVAQLLLPTLRKAWRDGLTSALTGADHE